MPSSLPIYVDVVLDKPRKLFYDFRAYKAFGKATGVNIMEINKQSMTPDLISAAIWAGLLHEDKELTIDQVDGMLHSGNLFEMLTKFKVAFQGNLPEAPKDAEGMIDPNAQPPAPQI